MLADGSGHMDILPGAQTSSCHAWGSNPTVWMTRELLGLAPTQPGFASFAFEPALGLEGSGSALPASVAGDVPTPHGGISASASLALTSGDAAVAVTRIEATHPAGTLPQVVLPQRLAHGGACAGAYALRRVFDGVSGAELSLTGATTSDGGARGALVHLPAAASVDGGVLSLTAEYRLAEGSAPCAAAEPAAAVVVAKDSKGDAWPYAPFAPPVWPAGSAWAVDNATHGGWVANGNIGRDGYVLFGYDAPSSSGGTPVDRVKLPAYIASVNVSTPSRQRYGAGSAAPSESLLQDPASPNGSRWLGAAYADSEASGLFGLFLDISTAGAGAGSEEGASAPAPAPLRSNPIYNLLVDINATTGATSGSSAHAPSRALRGAVAQPSSASTTAGAFRVTFYVADTTGVPNPGDQQSAASMTLAAEDLVTRNTLLPLATVRRYVPAPAYNGTVPANWNAGGMWGLEAGLYLSLTYDASVRLRVYCVSGCYGSVSAVFFDPA